MNHSVSICPSGDSAILIQTEQTLDPANIAFIGAAASSIREARIIGITDLIPASCSLMVCYDPTVVSYRELKKQLESALTENTDSTAHVQRRFVIPAVYGGAYGPDLARIAEEKGLSCEEVISIHTSAYYPVYMIGFLPGFPYLGGLDERLHAKRLEEPRLKIPAGSIGIAGSQTGIYPMESPGGWNLIARTPVRIFDPSKKEPVLLRASDLVRFMPVSEKEFEMMEQAVRDGKDVCIEEKGDASWESGL